MVVATTASKSTWVSKPPIPEREPERLAALARYEILDTPAERSFDELTALAAQILYVPMADVALVDADRQWIKSRHGTDAVETPRGHGFASHVVTAESLLIVSDARVDARFKANPSVTGRPGVRFYAGAPLVTPDGYVLGALGCYDLVPRHPGDAQVRALESLARQVSDQLELRRQLTERRRLTAIIDAMPDFVGMTHLDGKPIYLNRAGRRQMGIAPEGRLPDRISVAHPDWAARLIEEEAIPKALDTGAWLGETALRTPDGGEIPATHLVMALPRATQGPPLLATHVRDISEQKQLEALKDEFIATVSHELRTPLTSVRGALRLIEGGGDGQRDRSHRRDGGDGESKHRAPDSAGERHPRLREDRSRTLRARPASRRTQHAPDPGCRGHFDTGRRGGRQSRHRDIGASRGPRRRSPARPGAHQSALERREILR